MDGTFDGSYFTVPYDGIFWFIAEAIQHSKTEGKWHFYVNNKEMSRAQSLNAEATRGTVVLNKTMELKKNDKVKLGCQGDLFDLDKNTTFFEGKLIEKK